MSETSISKGADTEREVEALLFAAAGPLSESDLAKRLPEGADVPGAIAALQARFDRKDYAGVLGNAPAVLRAAHELGGAAAAQKAVVTAALNERWAALAAALPAAAAAAPWGEAAKRPRV